jgi:FtsH-binding integral membrane protein
MAIDTEHLGKQDSYEARAPLPSVLDDLEQILRVIEDRKAFRKKLRLYAGLCLVVSIVAGITSATIDKGLLFGLVSFPAFVACLVLFIYSFVYSNQMLKHRNRCQLMKELASSLQQDAGSRAVTYLPEP